MKTNKSHRLSVFAIFIIILWTGTIAQGQQVRVIQSFDKGWLFTKETITSGPENIGYDDSGWRKIDIPHDWTIEDLPNQMPDSIVGPFQKGKFILHQIGFTIGGTGWYRKKFVTEQTDKNKLVTIYFDGVYEHSDVWLNGKHLGNHVHGYTPFQYDLTPFLNPVGQENILVVRAKNEGLNSRWYSGSGIYRHVWLTVTDKVCIVPFGVYITTPKVSAESATVKIQTSVDNKTSENSDIDIVTTILAPGAKVVTTKSDKILVSPNQSHVTEQTISIAKPLLWDIDSPMLYTAITEIKQGKKIVDKVETTFGIRSLSFTAEKGFLLNGRRVILKGGCVHHDNGPLGSMAIDRAEERKIELLKKNGFNAIRTSHNPPSTALLNACDRLGILVLDEAFDVWNKPKSTDDYHLNFKDNWNKDITSMILRDRNHPSVILWSVGNEIPEKADSLGLATEIMLVQRVHELDPSRMVTEAVSRTPGWEAKTPAIFQNLDVCGYNYLMNKYESDHQKFPNRIMVGTETYVDKAFENFTMAEKYPYVVGDFVWTAIDYMGEAGLGNNFYSTTKEFKHNIGWPWFNANCGNLDLIGDKKPSSYYRDVVWRKLPLVMAVHAPIPDGMIENVSWFGWPDEMMSWTWPGAEGKSLQVRVFSRAPIVRLLLNGKIIGEQKISEGTITATFTVPYQSGILKAVNVENGKETDAVELKTAGAPVGIRLIADRNKIKADRNDLSYVNVEIVDANGNLVPNAENIEVNYTITGNGEIAGLGNGNPVDLSSFQQPKKKVFHGRGLAIVRPKGARGKITLTAKAKGLKEYSIEIITQ